MPEQTTSPLPPQTTAPAASETTMPAPTTVPPTTVPPTTQPELELEPGWTVTVDGDTLASGSVLYESVTYVKVEEFLLALDWGTVSGDSAEGFSLERDGTSYGFRPGNQGIALNGMTSVLSTPVLTWRGEIWVPVEELCQMMNISLFYDENQTGLYCTGIAGQWTWPEGVKIPVLMYHGVTDNTWGAAELFVSPADMEEQIAWLIENGYDTITFEDWFHLEDFDKPVMLTFDDGYMDNYEELFPILKKYNAKATIFAITYSVDRDKRTMTSAQAKEMTDSGLVSIQSHTYNHPHLSECNSEELQNQMLWSKTAVARMTGYEPIALCYPYGDSDQQAREAAMEHYKFGLAMTGGLYTTGQDVSQITRYYVSRYTSLSEFIGMVDDAGT